MVPVSPKTLTHVRSLCQSVSEAVNRPTVSDQDDTGIYEDDQI